MNPIVVSLICLEVCFHPKIISRTIKKRDIVKGSAVLILLAAIFFHAFNNFNADYKMYEYIYGTYANTLNNGRSILFEVICRISNILGFDYATFAALVITSCMVCVYQYIQKNSDYGHVILVLYIVAAAILDSIQIRQYIATAVFLLFLPFLTQDNTKKGKILYAVGILIASGFHVSFLFFLYFLVIKVDRKKRIKIAVAVLFIALFSFYLLQKSGMIFSLMTDFAGETKTNLYFYDTTYHNSAVQVWKYIVSQPVFMMAVLLLFKKFGKISDTNETYINTVIGMNLLMLTICPVLFYTLQFRRMFRVILVPTLIALFKMVSPKGKSIRILQFVIIILYCIISVYWNVNSNSDLYTNLFQYNIYF